MVWITKEQKSEIDNKGYCNIELWTRPITSAESTDIKIILSVPKEDLTKIVLERNVSLVNDFFYNLNESSQDWLFLFSIIYNLIYGCIWKLGTKISIF